MGLSVNQSIYSSVKRNPSFAMSAIRRNKNKKKKKKKINYNSREIPSQIQRAARPVGVSQVLVRAKGKVAQLQRCLVTGDYDTQEVRAAIAHANRMVACARKKLHNMEEEEMMKGMKKKRPEIARQNMEEMMLRRELEKLRRKHRGEEDRMIKDADIRYIKEKLRQQQRQAAAQREEMAEMTEVAASEVPLEMEPVDTAGVEAAVPSGSVDVLL